LLHDVNREVIDDRTVDGQLPVNDHGRHHTGQCCAGPNRFYQGAALMDITGPSPEIGGNTKIRQRQILDLVIEVQFQQSRHAAAAQK
jgi:hypothetical protein